MNGGDFLLYVFIGCLAFGIFYSAVSFLLGGHGDHGHDGGVGHGMDIGHDISAGHGVDIGHDISAGHGVDIGHDIGAGHGVDIGHDISAGHGVDIGHDISAGHGVDIGHDIGAGHGADIGHDAGTHNHASHGDDADSPSPFNPMVIASSITTFGAIGLISMTGFGLDSLMSTIVALGFAGTIGVALFFGVVKFMYGSQSNSVFSLEDLIGFEAEVITPLPENGLGEIAYKANGIRSTLSARSTEGVAVKRGTAVIIREIVGSVALVQQKLTIDDIVLDSAFENSNAAGSAGDAEDTDDMGDMGDAEDTDDMGDIGAFEEADSGKPRRNAGNK